MYTVFYLFLFHFLDAFPRHAQNYGQAYLQHTLAGGVLLFYVLGLHIYARFTIFLFLARFQGTPARISLRPVARSAQRHPARGLFWALSFHVTAFRACKLRLRRLSSLAIPYCPLRFFLHFVQCRLCMFIAGGRIFDCPLDRTFLFTPPCFSLSHADPLDIWHHLHIMQRYAFQHAGATGTLAVRPGRSALYVLLTIKLYCCQTNGRKERGRPVPWLMPSIYQRSTPSWKI